MNLTKAEIYYPKTRKNKPIKYLCFGAHQDDVEIMAFDGILKGYMSRNYSFAAVVTTDGGGSARTGAYKDYTYDMMKEVRIQEQKDASEIGRYETLYLLNYTSKEVKDPNTESLIDDYYEILKHIQPEVVYTHNLLDKHDTHIGVVIKVIKAIRRLPKEMQPKVVYGCEVWRDLDWVNSDRKVEFNVSRKPKLAKDILNVFKSQIAGGKRYDLATTGRRLANATYAQSHSVDNAKMVSVAIDLTPLIKNPELSIKEFALSFVDDFKKTIYEQHTKLGE